MFIMFQLWIGYALLMGAYLAVAAAIVFGALLLTLWPRARRTTKKLAAGVIGSIPFMLFFQGLSLPVLAAIMLLTSIFGLWTASPATALIMMVANSVLALQAVIFLAASVAGGVTGYGIGARMATGAPVRSALSGSRILSRFAAGLTRVLPVSTAVTPVGAIVSGLCAILFTVTALAVINLAYVQAFGTDEIEYRGEKFQLSKKYVDYDDYKNDPNNLAPSEIARVESIITQVRIGPDFADWKDFIGQVQKIRFPGYGGGGMRLRMAVAGREFLLESIEIPQVGRDRCFVLEKRADGSLHLVDDFVIAHDQASAFAPISSIGLVGETLIYSDRRSNVVREINLSAQR